MKKKIKINDVQTEEEMLKILGYKDKKILNIVK